MPDVSKLTGFSRPETITHHSTDRPTAVQIKNRRLHYLRTHPEYFTLRSETVRDRGGLVSFARSVPQYDDTSRSGRWSLIELREPSERIGGPISANLLEAYDLDRRLSQQVHTDSGPSPEEDTESEDSAASDTTSSARRDMVETFLAGRDDDFDYTTVDNDETLDDLDTLTREAQEKFFDEEDESVSEQDIAQQEDSQTGILDY